jgi:hypothetical protein
MRELTQNSLFQLIMTQFPKNLFKIMKLHFIYFWNPLYFRQIKRISKHFIMPFSKGWGSKNVSRIKHCQFLIFSTTYCKIFRHIQWALSMLILKMSLLLFLAAKIGWDNLETVQGRKMLHKHSNRKCHSFSKWQHKIPPYIFCHLFT